MDDLHPSLFQALPDAVYVIDPATSRIVDCNRAAHEDLLLARDDVLEHSVLSLQTRVHGMPAWSAIAEVIRRNSPYRFIGGHRRADGSELPVEVVTSVATLNGEERFISVARDISRRPGVAAPPDERATGWQILHDLADGVWDWYPAQERLVFSPRLHSLLGYGPEEMPEVIETWKDNVHPDDLPVVITTLQDHLAGERHQFEAVYRLRNRNGHYLWVHDRGSVVDWDDEGRPLRVTGLVHDVTDAKAVEARLQREADRDMLTGLLNRRKGMGRLEELLARAQRSGRRLALIALDVDHFKPVNDRYGHLVGDSVLEALGRLIAQHAPPDAVAMRWGGEEFLIGLPLDDGASGCRLATTLLTAIEARDWPEPLQDETITASAGVTRSDPRIESINDLIAAADRALYLAKREGRNRVAQSEYHPPCHAERQPEATP
ncbi:diguanylate cyclase [Guyparkeria hydrothermalis]|uniref:sensor domain-containing diguanylate cyclase n=1 Tax=Guyparkeria TaxID=2035712 RepID=UPI0010AC09C4|nr:MULTISPECIES: diguanylate cyclase [Guyparkeria]MCL7750814.1 diguanylate cyclase [Guyparkeria hydrothermalis]TKA88875.1 diguanylate cyclase [Guyparkeria sp. SB14A]